MLNKNEILLDKFYKIFTEYFGDEMASAFIDGLKSKSVLQDKMSVDDPEFSRQMVEVRIIIDSTVTYAQSILVSDIYVRFILDITTILSESCCINLAEEILINTISDVRSDKTYALLLMLLADISIRKSFWDNSINLLNQAVEILTELDDILNLAKCENLFGTLYGEKGEIQTAKNHFLKGTEYLKDNIDENLAANLENNLAILENITGNLELAKEHYHIALKKFEAINQMKKIAEIRHNLGMLNFADNQFEKAIEEFDKAINIAIQHDYKTVLAISYLGKANTYLCINNSNETSAYCYKAMDAAIKVDDKLTIADIYRIIGILEKEMNHYDTAESYFHVSLRLNKELGNKLNYAESAFELGNLYKQINNSKDKSEWLNRALSYYTEINAEGKILEINELLK
ncbi:tetratricopeptide repeat protein [Bacteroidota bacterium]